MELVSSLLSLDPSARPSVRQVMAHHWLAPQLYKIPTSLGALRPIHPKSASRSRHRKRQVGRSGLLVGHVTVRGFAKTAFSF